MVEHNSNWLSMSMLYMMSLTCSWRCWTCCCALSALVLAACTYWDGLMAASCESRWTQE